MKLQNVDRMDLRTIEIAQEKARDLLGDLLPVFQSMDDVITELKKEIEGLKAEVKELEEELEEVR